MTSENTGLGHMEKTENEEGTSLRVFCSECGHELEPGEEFCYLCGSVRTFTVTENGRVVSEEGVCPICGCKNVKDTEFCEKCGRRLGEYEFEPTRRTPLGPKDYAILLIAFIPGALNIFGLGHLFLKKYSRGFMYLMISFVLLYVIYFTPDLGRSMYFFLELIGFMIYLKQSFEVLYEVYHRRE